MRVEDLKLGERDAGVQGAEWTREREFFIDKLLVQIHFIRVMIRWSGLAPWEFEFSFPGSRTSTFLEVCWIRSRLKGQGAWCGAQGVECGVRDAGCRVCGAGCGVRGSECRVRGSGCRV